MNETYEYAKRLAISLANEHWPDNDSWQPLPTLLGVLTQIDNMTTLMRDQKAEIERLRDAIEYARSEGFEWPTDPLPVK